MRVEGGGNKGGGNIRTKATKADIIDLAKRFEQVMLGIRPESQQFTATTSVDRWNANTESISQFAYLVVSLAEQVFGVDCDGDCQIRIRIEDRKRHEAFHYRPVPRVPMDCSFEQICAALRVAQMNLSIASKDVEQLLRQFDDGTRNAISKLRMRAQAVGCQKCKGNGFLRDSRSYAERQNEDTRDPMVIHNRNAYYKPSGFLFCECQSPDKHWLGQFDPLDEGQVEDTIEDL